MDADAGGMVRIDVRKRGGQARRPRRRCVDLRCSDAVEAEQEQGGTGQSTARDEALKSENHGLSLRPNAPTRPPTAPTPRAGRRRVFPASRNIGKRDKSHTNDMAVA